MYVENIRNYYDILIWLTNSGEDEAEDVRPASVALDARPPESQRLKPAT
jgi:membrane-bound lytic murein transglycosylase MltF